MQNHDGRARLARPDGVVVEQQDIDPVPGAGAGERAAAPPESRPDVGKCDHAAAGRQSLEGVGGSGTGVDEILVFGIDLREPAEEEPEITAESVFLAIRNGQSDAHGGVANYIDPT
jgi:hypothetical protein